MTLVDPEHWSQGFVRDGSDKLVSTTSLVGAVYSQGFLRDPDGRLVVSAGPGSYVAGFIRDANGALVVAANASTPPLYPFA